MNNQTTSTHPFTSRSTRPVVNNPAGRADVLLARVLERVVESDKRISDVMRAAYYAMQGDVERELTRLLGPRTKAGRTIRKAVIGARRAKLI